MFYVFNYCNVSKKMFLDQLEIEFFNLYFLIINDVVGYFFFKRLLCDLFLQIY